MASGVVLVLQHLVRLGSVSYSWPSILKDSEPFPLVRFLPGGFGAIVSLSFFVVSPLPEFSWQEKEKNAQEKIKICGRNERREAIAFIIAGCLHQNSAMHTCRTITRSGSVGVCIFGPQSATKDTQRTQRLNESIACIYMRNLLVDLTAITYKSSCPSCLLCVLCGPNLI
jgi:hypothetical protein